MEKEAEQTLRDNAAYPKKKRKYQKVDLDWRMEIIQYAVENSNRKAARKYGIDEKAIRRWRKPEMVPISRVRNSI